jgi:hypothetical protein
LSNIKNNTTGIRKNILLLQGIIRIIQQPDDNAGEVPCHEETGQDQSQGQDQKQVGLYDGNHKA